MALFSRRNVKPKDLYDYEISDLARRRLFFALKEHFTSQDFLGNNCELPSIFEEMQSKILRAYGTFRTAGSDAEKVKNQPVTVHFFACSDEEFMDFLEMCFETRRNFGRQPTVELINRVLSEENIGYELSDYSTVYGEPELSGDSARSRVGLNPNHGRTERIVNPGVPFKTVLPKAIRKDEKVLHAETVKPCLTALSDPRFVTANKELLAAFDERGKGRFGDAITDAGAAFESVLKVICVEKKWPYDKDKDTCAKLLEICQTNTLFHSFYRTVLETTATVRNKLGDAHGKGPTEHFPPTKDYADHMLYMVCNNVTLLISLAKL